MTTYTSFRILPWKLPLLLICLIQFQDAIGRESALFPFGDGQGDILAPHESSEYTIKFPHTYAQFAGYKYKELQLEPYGSLSFKSTIFRFFEWGKKIPAKDTPFIAPLYIEAMYAGETKGNEDAIFYRIIKKDSPLLVNLTSMIQKSVVGASSFEPTGAIVITWQNIRNRVHRTEISDKTTNMFQLVFVFKNEDESYAIFNYDRVNPIKYYPAGINSGFHKGWTNVVPSNKPDTDHSRLPFIDVGLGEGRFVFRVTDEKPDRGGCSPDQSTLSVYPKSAGMFGGEMLEVSAPCLHSNMILECIFRSKAGSEVRSPATMINRMKAKCVVPRLMFRGDITLAFTTDGGASIAAETPFHIVLPSFVPRQVETATQGGLSVWDQRDAKDLGVLWDPTSLTRDPDATVNVNLIGYKETRRSKGYKLLRTLGSNIRNKDGRFTFKPIRNRCSGESCDYEIGMIEVKLTDPSLADDREFLNTKILPIGWFVTAHLKRNLGNDWPNKKCEEMKDDREHHEKWLESLSECPCTLDQAIADFGRWIAAADCNIFVPSTCRYHDTAVHCVRSTETTPTSSGNQCCYRKDGSLMYSSDSKHGSTPDKAAALGKHPFDKLNHVPELSHWVWDVIPYYYCCLWGSQCTTYMNERPTTNCKGYEPPTTVTIFGDPHIITSNGFAYTMQAIGDYWLMKTTTIYSKSLELQGSFVKSNLVKVDKENFSKLNAISLKNSDGDVIEVRMRGEPYDVFERLDVLVNGNYIQLNKERGFMQIFKNMAIFDNIRNGRQQNLTIITDSGIGIKIAEGHGTMPVILTIPPAYKGIVAGLFGTWTDEETSELTFKNGTNVNMGNIEEMQQYVDEWAVKKENSLFRYYNAADQSFMPHNSSSYSIPPDFLDVCGKGGYNHLCKHDYIVTANKYIAQISADTIEQYESLSASQKQALNCGRLEVENARFDHANYTVGNSIFIVGCNYGFLLEGHATYKCVEKEGKLEWEPEVDSECLSREEEINNTGLIVAISLGAVVVIFILTVIICVIYKKLKPKKNKPEKAKNAAEAENMITMKDKVTV